MKIFALYLRLDLTTKPTWFDEIWENYSQTSILHITLIQTRYIKDDQIQDLKNKVAHVVKETNLKPEDRRVIFDKTEIEREDEKHSLLMWFIKRNQSITDLQKKMIHELEDYDAYCAEITRGYETYFRPHLTVADKIVDQIEIKKLILREEKCEGLIKDLVLAIVKDGSREESENSNNWTIFNF